MLAKSRDGVSPGYASRLIGLPDVPLLEMDNRLLRLYVPPRA